MFRENKIQRANNAKFIPKRDEKTQWIQFEFQILLFHRSFNWSLSSSNLVVR